MKIHDKTIFQWNDDGSFTVIEDVSHDYNGPVAECKGGGSTTTNTQDTAYNARMATIAEQQQAQATEMYNWIWGKGTGETPSYMDLQEQQIKANTELIPAQTGLQQEQLAAERQLLPGQTELAGAQTDAGIEKIGYQRELMPTYFNEVNKGLDVKGRMNEASADVTQAYAGLDDQARRNAARMGMSPMSSRTLSRLTDTNLNRARDIASARTTARRTAETENLANLRQAMST